MTLQLEISIAVMTLGLFSKLHDDIEFVKFFHQVTSPM